MITKTSTRPNGGCDRCGAYTDEGHNVLKNYLVREDDVWLCRSWVAEQHKSTQTNNETC
ncbi:hypothetical protein [Syntrophotalea acetylenica]|uniref:hypothetical protein n=1 Tax=Syntrophotalea acetylenica TaxID=29542 RepID=UPI000A91D483|nr:hypothetical protein [Syntrophotalea acetylenica]